LHPGPAPEQSIGNGSCAYNDCSLCVDGEYGADMYRQSIGENPRGKISDTVKQIFGKCLDCCQGNESKKKSSGVKVVEGTKTNGLTYAQIKGNSQNLDQTDNMSTISNKAQNDGSFPKPITNIPQAQPKHQWQEKLLQMHGGPGSAYFWGWDRTVSASDVRGLFRAILATYPTKDKNNIFIYSGSHGDKNGRFDFDVPQDQQTLAQYREIKFWHEDVATVDYEAKMKRLRGWQVTLRNLEIYNAKPDGFMVNLANELKPTSNFRHVIWAFCYSADGTNSDTKTVTQHTIARRNLRVEESIWTVPTYPGVDDGYYPF